MEVNLRIKKIVLMLLIIVVFSGGLISIFGIKDRGYAEAKNIESSDVLEFLKNGYNVYWNIEESLDEEYIVKYEDKEYMKVVKNFHSRDDIKKYLLKYYTVEAAEKFLSELSPRLIEGDLFVLAGQAGDKPFMNSGVIVDDNLKKGCITLKFKDNNQDLYLKAFVTTEDGKLKIQRWKVL